MEEKPDIPVYRPLDMEERDRLLSILSDPVFIKAWNNAEIYKPSAFPSMAEHFEGEHGDNRAAKQLCRIQGWGLHKAALIKQSLETVSKPKKPLSEYPDSGSLEAEVARTISQSTVKSK